MLNLYRRAQILSFYFTVLSLDDRIHRVKTPQMFHCSNKSPTHPEHIRGLLLTLEAYPTFLCLWLQCLGVFPPRSLLSEHTSSSTALQRLPSQSLYWLILNPGSGPKLYLHAWGALVWPPLDVLGWVGAYGSVILIRLLVVCWLTAASDAQDLCVLAEEPNVGKVFI